MKKYLKILKECPLFRDIESSNLLKMLTCLDAKVESFDKKYTIFSEGTPARYLGIVLTGSVQVVRIDYYGNRSILTELGSGQVFSEEFSCAGLPTIPVSVIADDPCDVMLIDCSHILHTCSNNCAFHQQLIFNLMKNLAEKAILFHQKVEIAAKRTTREKLMTYLMFQAKKAGSNRFRIPFDRQELADYLEVDRSGLSAEISKLRKEGVLESDKNTFVLL